ncbi:MAG: hypothetical protein H5U06_03955 [Candidatus Aminicenantes bacterium]|nr:hypothetical protein [Candidatus Aminicenantes bacterium]
MKQQKQKKAQILAAISTPEKMLIGLGILLTIISAGFFAYHSFMDTCIRCINQIIKNDSGYYRYSAIYLISSVNSFCRPCAKYDQLKNDPDRRIIFLLEPDYSDADIENFRRAFNLTSKEDIRRMDSDWKKIYLKCNKNKWNLYYNFLIVINEGKVDEIRRF